MAVYKMDSGTIVDTSKADQTWREATYFDGNADIGRSSGSQMVRQRLHRSRKGNYYIEHLTQWEDEIDSAEWVSRAEAAAWLLQNEHAVPDDLTDAADEITE